MTVVLGKMDVVWVNPYRSGQGEPPVHLVWVAPYRPAAVIRLRGRGRGRLFVCLFLGGRRPPGPDYTGRWGIRDNVWKGQKEGSVVVLILHLTFLFCPKQTARLSQKGAFSSIMCITEKIIDS